jgi:hypothetical protein
LHVIAMLVGQHATRLVCCSGDRQRNESSSLAAGR